MVVKVHAINDPKLVVLSRQIVRKENSWDYKWVMVNLRNKEKKKVQLSLKLQDKQVSVFLGGLSKQISKDFPFKPT